MAENFPKLAKTIKIQIQEVEQNHNRINPQKKYVQTNQSNFLKLNINSKSPRQQEKP